METVASKTTSSVKQSNYDKAIHNIEEIVLRTTGANLNDYDFEEALEKVAETLVKLDGAMQRNEETKG